MKIVKFSYQNEEGDTLYGYESEEFLLDHNGIDEWIDENKYFIEEV